MSGLCQFRFSDDHFHLEIETFDLEAFYRHWMQLQDANLRWESLFSSFGCTIVRNCKHKFADNPRLFDNIEWASEIQLPSCSTLVPAAGWKAEEQIDRAATRVFVIVYVAPIDLSVENYHCLLSEDEETTNQQLLVFVDSVSDNFVQDNKSQSRDHLFIGKVKPFKEYNPCPHPRWLCFHLEKSNNKFWTIDMTKEDDYDHRFHFDPTCLSDELVNRADLHPGNFVTLRSLLRAWQRWLMERLDRETVICTLNDNLLVESRTDEFWHCPDDMVMCVFEYLPVYYVVCKASQVCKQWKRLSRHTRWERKATEYFEDNQLPGRWRRIFALCVFGPGWWTHHLLQKYSRNQLYQAFASLPDDNNLCVESCTDSITTQAQNRMLHAEKKFEMLHAELVTYLAIYQAVIVLLVNALSVTIGQLCISDSVGKDTHRAMEVPFATAMFGMDPKNVTFVCLTHRKEGNSNVSLASLRQAVLELDSLWI